MNTATLISIAFVILLDCGVESRKPHDGGLGPIPKPHGGNPHNRWHDSRNLTIKYDTDSIQFFSRNPETGDRVWFSLRSEGNSPMRFNLAFFPSNKTENATLMSHVQFGSIIEFAESESVFDGLDEDDSIKSRLVLSRFGWGPISHPVITDIPNGHLYNFSVKYKEVLELVVLLADTQYQLGSDEYEPGQVKIDVIIDGYNYTENGTYLALECFVHSPSLFSKGGGAEEEEIRTFVKDVSMAFGWKRTVTADGDNNVSVVATPFTFVREKGPMGKGRLWKHSTNFAFDVVQPKRIVWDPVVGVQGSAPVLSVMLAFAVALINAAFGQ